MKIQRCHSLETLKNRAAPAFKQGAHVSGYVIAWGCNSKLNPSAAYRVALDFGLSKKIGNPQKFASAVRFAAIIRRDYGAEAFGDFLKEIEAKG